MKSAIFTGIVATVLSAGLSATAQADGHASRSVAMENIAAIQHPDLPRASDLDAFATVTDMDISLANIQRWLDPTLGSSADLNGSPKDREGRSVAMENIEAIYNPNS